jgi:hypothetical protein
MRTGHLGRDRTPAADDGTSLDRASYPAISNRLNPGARLSSQKCAEPITIWL